MNEDLTITLRDLASSGCLSKCSFSFDDEDGRCNASVGGNSKLLNAAKLSLLLAKLFARVYTHGRGEKGAPYSSSLVLDDFLLSLSNKSSNGIAVAETIIPGEIDIQPLALNAHSGLLESNDDLSSYLTMINFLGNLEMNSEQNNETCIKAEGGKIIDLAGSTQDSTQDTQDTIVRKISPSPDKEIFDTINNAAGGGNNHWTLQGMDIRVPGSSSETEIMSASQAISLPNMMRHLGSLIYAILISSKCCQTRNQTLPESLGRLAVMEENGAANNWNNLTQRNSKMRRGTDHSLFAELIDIGFPVAICRLLSDMIDIGQDGRSESPMTSFTDVIKDIEQIVTHPQLYLDDMKDHFLSPLRFGTGCYGRTEEVTTILKLASNLENNTVKAESVDAIFVRGCSGSGKTHLVQSVGEFLARHRWMVLNAKFESGAEHESRNVVCGLFDKLLSALVALRDGGVDAEVDFSRRATEAISEAFDRECMVLLAAILPSTKELIGIEKHCVDLNAADCLENSNWQLIYLLSTLLVAVLSLDDCHLMIYFDDLQWSECGMLSVIFEVVVSMGRLPHRQKFLFVGLCRGDEISPSHHFTTQYGSLQKNKNVNVTCIDLPNLSKNDVTSLMMAEMALPERLVRDFAAVVHKKTLGHALFTVQLLNALVHDSIVFHSPTKHRYDWDNSKINVLQKTDSVAKLIASNISSLPAEAQQSLRILAYFGMQTHRSIIDHLKGCPAVQGADNIKSSLPILTEAGIVECNDSSVVFSHDLLLNSVYEAIPLAERRSIHQEIGTYLGATARLDLPSTQNEVTEFDSCADSSLPPELTTIATDQINNADLDLNLAVDDDEQRIRFLRWNLRVANESAQHGNFLAALHYCNKGIAFLCCGWLDGSPDLCYSLYEKASQYALASGKYEQAPQYANMIIEHVPFERSLDAQYMLIQSLDAGIKSRECMTTAMSVLKKLGFELPKVPKVYFSYLFGYVCGTTPSVITQRMSHREEDEDNFDKLIGSGQNKVDATKRKVLSILDLIAVATRWLKSPYLPLIICEAVKYILEQQCNCVESITALSYYCLIMIWFEEDYVTGRKWAMRAQKIMETAQHIAPVSTHIALYGLTMSWFMPLSESSDRLFKAYELGMKVGDVAKSMMALHLHIVSLYTEGEKLSIVSSYYDRYLPLMAKYNKRSAQMSIPLILNIDLLRGRESSNPFSIFEGLIPDENHLILACRAEKDFALLSTLYKRRFVWNTYNDDYSEAEKWYRLDQSLRSAKLPHISDVEVDFVWGLLAFHQYRDGKGEKYFNEGKRMLEKMEVYDKHARHVCQNKLSLLKAEAYASMSEVNKAKKAYDAAIRTALIQGRTRYNEGRAQEMKGKFLLSIVDFPGATECFKNAYACYMQYGAKHLAEKLQRYLSDDMLGEINDKDDLAPKRGRNW